MSENKITLEALAVEEKKVEIEQERDTWSLCCSKSSASLIRYIGQMVCCASVLTFSFIKFHKINTETILCILASSVESLVICYLPRNCKKIIIDSI